MVTRIRAVRWDQVDQAVAEALLTTGSRARRVIADMIQLAGGGAGGAGISTADKARIVVKRTRTPANEAAPTANNWEPRPSGWGLVIAVGKAPAPADAQPGDMHFIPTTTGALTSTTNFNTPDGAAWPTPWVLAQTPAGGGATVQGGAGKLTSGNAGGYAPRDRVAMRYGDALANAEVVWRYKIETGDAHPRLVLRSDTANLDPANGAVVDWDATGISVANVNSYTYNVIATAPLPSAQGVDYTMRVSLNGPTLKVRAWPTAQTEPDTWAITTTVDATAGYAGFTVGSGGPAASQTVAFDDIAFSTGTSGYGSAYGVAYGL